MPINFKAGTIQTNVTNNWTARQVFSGDAVFGSGHPWMDVRAFGAVGDGATDDTSAFTACWNAVNSQPYQMGNIYISPGSYLISSPLPVLSNDNLSIFGAGQSSRIIANSIGTITDFMKFTNAFYFSARDFLITAQGTSTITNMFHYTASVAAETCYLANITVLNAGKAANGVVIGGDTNLDVSEIELFGVTSADATNAQFKFGISPPSGSNDVLEIQCHGCVAYSIAQATPYGVWSNGGFTWVGGFAGFHTVCDFFQAAPSSTPLSISQVESQGSKRFLDFTPAALERGSPITLDGVTVSGFTDAAGKVLKIRSAVPVNLIGFQSTGANHVTAFELGGCSVNAVGIVTDAQNPFSLAESDVQWNWAYPRKVSNADGTNQRLVNTPTVAVGAALGTGGSVGALISGNDEAGRIILTAGTTSLTTGDMCTMTFSAAHPPSSRPRVVLTPASSNSGSLTTHYLNEPGCDNTKFVISTNTAPTSGFVYYFTYHVDHG